jgi:hypothetical protein
MAKLFGFDIKVDIPKLEIKSPTSAFWEKVGLAEVKAIRVRTEQRGKDAEGTDFKPYTPAYAAFRVKTGRRSFPNLSFSSRMLGSMAKGIRATKDGVVVQMSGEEGGKAFANEQRGRIFFAYNDTRATAILKEYSDWLDRHGLK